MNDATCPLTIYYESACALCNAEMTHLRLRNTQGLVASAFETGIRRAAERAAAARCDGGTCRAGNGGAS